MRSLPYATGRSARNGRDRIAIDLVVSDLVMPGIGGRELVGRLRRTLPTVPVLYVSGHAADGPPILVAKHALVPREAVHRAPSCSLGEVGPVTRRRVLIVEDERLLGEAMCELLGDDHDVELASTVAAATKRLRDDAELRGHPVRRAAARWHGRDVFRGYCASWPERAQRFVFVTGGTDDPTRAEPRRERQTSRAPQAVRSRRAAGVDRAASVTSSGSG